MTKDEVMPITVMLLTMALVLVASFGAWVQHFITAVSEEMWVLLVIGAIIPPIGVLHGWLIWLQIL